MPRTAEQNQQIKDKRQTKLLAFALKAFAANGYNRTTIDDVTKLARCSHGLFYHYFDSKEAVFAALIDEYLTKEAEVPVQAALQEGGAKGLRLLCDYAERVANGTPKDFAVAKITVFLEDATNLDQKGREFASTHDLKSALATLIAQGQQEKKVIAGDPKAIAQAVIDMARGGLTRLSLKGESLHVSSDILFEFLLKTPIDE
ncbi:MAG: TetR/AcrR family transcriptional regulator [Bacilli bacterium]|nr:TetR/AcrR family transcriptional regulator [Bacilli bacterium]